MQNSAEGQKTKGAQLMVREALSSKRENKEELVAGFSESLDNSDEDEASFDTRMRQQILRRRKDLGDLPTKKDLPAVETKGCMFDKPIVFRYVL